MNKSQTFISFEKFSDALLWLWVVGIALFYKFFKWFIVREYDLRVSSRLKTMDDRIRHLDKSLQVYRTDHHGAIEKNEAVLNRALDYIQSIERANEK
jgi:hypothetical protein